MSPLWAPIAPVPMNYLAPTGASFETYQRQGLSLAADTLTSGTLLLVGIQLPAGNSVGRICFTSNTTAAGTPVNWWFGLYDSSRVQLAITADQTTTAWAASTSKNLVVATTAAGAASSFVTTYAGLHYLGVMVKATTTPTLAGGTVTTGASGQAPIISGMSDTVQTTPPAFPRTVTALTVAPAYPYAWVGP